MASGDSLLAKRLLIPWAILVALAVLLTLGVGVQGVDYATPFALAAMYEAVVGAELFFLLVVAPLASGGERRAGLLELMLLWAMAAPVVVVAWWVSDCDAASVAASQGYVLAVGFLVAGYLRADGEGRFRRWYWLAVGLLSAGAPVLAFLAGDLFDAQLTWLYALSPFWVAARISQPWQVGWDWAAPVAATLLLACLFQLLPSVRPQVGPSLPGESGA